MAVEEIELRLTVDGRPAQKALDETRSMAERLGGGLKNLQQGFGAMQQRIGPAAAAISSVSSALAVTNGEAGKVMNAVGQITAAFAAGGPYAAALAAAAVSVDALSQSWENEIKQQDAAREAAYKYVDAAFKGVLSLEKQNYELQVSVLPIEWQRSKRRKDSLATLDAEIKRLQEIKTLTDEEQKIVRGQILAAEKSKKLVEENYQLQEKAARLQKTEADQQEFDRKRAEAARKAEEEERQRQERAIARRQAGDASLTFLGQWKKERDAGLAAEREQAADDALEADIDRMAAAGQATRDFEQLKTEITRDYSEERGQIIAAEAEKEKAAIEQRNSMIAATAMGMASTLASASDQLLTDIITGQEHATERFAAFIMQQAGQALISNGVQLIGEGTKNVLIGNPMAAGQFVGAASLIGMGISLGGIATGVTHAAAGGKFGQKVPTDSTSGRASDPGARARPTSGMAGGGTAGQNVTIIYGGISGPSADDGARALTKAARRANRRGLA